MNRLMMILVVAAAMQTAPAMGRDLIDKKTKEYTPYGVAVSLIAAAQISELSCHKKDQVALALAKVNRAGVAIDLNNKEDYAFVLFQAERIVEKAMTEGESQTKWCLAKSDQLDQLLRSR